MSDANQAVFLSYASQDAEAVRRIAEALWAAGVEVWFDQNELVGGDAWDKKIRGQIKACALFVPVISAATQARREGYFRLEWKLAAQRTHMISERQAFLLPVVIDGTSDAAADVPEEFRAVQWTRLRQGYGGQALHEPSLETFCVRVGTLLGDEGRDGSPGRPSGETVESSGRLGETSLPRKLRRAWLWPTVLGAAVLVALGVLVSRTWRGAEANLASATAGSRPEVAALLERVRALTRKTDVVRAELDGAVGLLEQAAKLDGADPEVWALWALIDCRYASEWLDRSTARFDLAQRHATQAMGLGPKSPAARLAQVTAMTLLSGDRATKLAAIALLEPLVGEPGDRADALILLANLKWDLGYADEASSYLDRAAKYPSRIGQVHYQRAARYLFSGQCQRSQEEIDRALAVEPAAKFQLWKSYLLMIWQGDVEGSRRVMREIPPAMLVEDFPASARYFVSLWARDYDGAVAAMRAVPRDYLESGALRGPTGYFKGYALARWGKPAAAETEWRAALEVVERRLGAQPNERGLLSLKALLLKSLGETAAAGKMWRTLRELYGESIESWEDHFARLESLPDEEAINYRAEGAKQSLPMALAASLRLDPFVDRLRTNPRFIELLAQIEADPRLSPKAKPATAAGTTMIDAKSVAVLAFANVGGDKENEVFSDGISEELINVLGRVPGLTVKGRASSFFFKGSTATAQEKGQRLGATYLVDGSVRRQGNAVRITAQVSRAATDEVVWTSEPLVRELKDMWAVQEEIAGLIAKALSLKLGVAAGAATAEVNPQAFELYLQGRQAWNRRTLEDYQRAEVLFSRAIDLDPKFARAYVGRADARTYMAVRKGQAGTWGQRNAPQLVEVEEDLQQALKLAPDLAEGHASLGNFHGYRGNREDAQRSLERAISLNANYATAHQWLGLHFWRQGRLSEARVSALRAVEVDPLSSVISAACSVVLQDFGESAAALVHAERAVALQPDSWRAVGAKSTALWAVGRKEEAVAVARSVVESNPSTQGLGRALLVLGRAGLTAEVETKRNVSGGLAELVRLQGAVAMGRWDEFFSGWGPNSLTTDDPWFLYMPDLDAVRGDTRFLAVLKEAGLAEAHARAQAWRAALGKGR